MSTNAIVAPVGFDYIRAYLESFFPLLRQQKVDGPVLASMHVPLEAFATLKINAEDLAAIIRYLRKRPPPVRGAIDAFGVHRRHDEANLDGEIRKSAPPIWRLMEWALWCLFSEATILWLGLPRLRWVQNGIELAYGRGPILGTRWADDWSTRDDSFMRAETLDESLFVLENLWSGRRWEDCAAESHFTRYELGAWKIPWAVLDSLIISLRAAAPSMPWEAYPPGTCGKSRYWRLGRGHEWWMTDREGCCSHEEPTGERAQILAAASFYMPLLAVEVVRMRHLADQPTEALKLSIRTTAICKKMGYANIYDFLSKPPFTLSVTRGIGEKRYEEIVSCLAALGWTLGDGFLGEKHDFWQEAAKKAFA